MAGRIRCIKPEILEDERSASLSSNAWRLWVSMWLLADDYGNLRGEPRRLAADIFWAAPGPISVPDMLEELVSAGLLQRYTVRGQQYINITNWKKHQRIDNAGKGRVPGISESDSAEFCGESPRDSASRGGLPLDPDLRSPTSDPEDAAKKRELDPDVPWFTAMWGRRANVLLPDAKGITESLALVREYAAASGSTDLKAVALVLIEAYAKVASTWSTPRWGLHLFIRHWDDVQAAAKGKTESAGARLARAAAASRGDS